MLDQIYLLVYVNLFMLLHFGYSAVFYLLLLIILLLSFSTRFLSGLLKAVLIMSFYSMYLVTVVAIGVRFVWEC
jgi:high-affinity K+ transport system ATPase subunit B